MMIAEKNEVIERLTIAKILKSLRLIELGDI
jgi:hypothetical protein